MRAVGAAHRSGGPSGWRSRCHESWRAERSGTRRPFHTFSRPPRAMVFRFDRDEVGLELVLMIRARKYLLTGFLGACLLVAVWAKTPPAPGGTLELDRVWTGKLSSGT